jgi:peptide/nickel transport system substrate-binding protein
MSPILCSPPDIEAAKALVAESSYAGNVPSFEVPVVNGSTNMAAGVIIQDALVAAIFTCA